MPDGDAAGITLNLSCMLAAVHRWWVAFMALASKSDTVPTHLRHSWLRVLGIPGPKHLQPLILAQSCGKILNAEPMPSPSMRHNAHHNAACFLSAPCAAAYAANAICPAAFADMRNAFRAA